MSEEKIQLNLLDGGIHQVEIRQGSALPLRDPVKLNLEGNIDTVRRFLEKRAGTLNQKTCNIEVIRLKNKPGIQLNINETDYYSGSVSGRIIMDEDFKEFGINTGKKYSLRDLSDFIKMHRYCFDDVSVAMKLVTELRSFKAKVSKDMEKNQDTRGNQKILMDQVVESNIPESFTLSMPLFKSHSVVKFKVEINIIVRDADMECMLESVEANDLVVQYCNTMIDSELFKIGELASDIVQIEI